MVSHFKPVNWPLRSYDRMLVEYFLWGSLKSPVCALTPEPIDHLKANIYYAVADIRPQIMIKSIKIQFSDCLTFDKTMVCLMPKLIFKF